MSYSHEWGVQHQTFFGPAPWGPGEGPKGQISFNFNGLQQPEIAQQVALLVYQVVAYQLCSRIHIESKGKIAQFALGFISLY